MATDRPFTRPSPTNRDHHGDEYPPSRPGLKTLIALVLVILFGLAVVYWPQIRLS